MVTLPAKGSAMVLKTRAVSGPPSLASHRTAFPLASVPVAGGRSSGDGNASTTRSRRGVTPMFRAGAPHRMGKSFCSRIPRTSPSRTSLSLSSPLSRYFSSNRSSASATASTRAARWPSASSRTVAGTSSSVGLPLPSGVKRRARMRTRSTTPTNPASWPMGTCTGIALADRFLRTSSTARAKSARSRSILER